MIAYLCNRCKKPIDLEKEYCTHLEITWGKSAIETKGRYGSGYSADLCEECYESIAKQIDCYYYGVNKYLKGDTNDSNT